MTTVPAASRSSRSVDLFESARGEEARGLTDGALLMDAAPALTLGGALAGGDLGGLVSVAAWILMAAAAVKIAAHNSTFAAGDLALIDQPNTSVVSAGDQNDFNSTDLAATTAWGTFLANYLNAVCSFVVMKQS